MLSRKKIININQHHVWKREIREASTCWLSCQRYSRYSECLSVHSSTLCRPGWNNRPQSILSDFQDTPPCLSFHSPPIQKQNTKADRKPLFLCLSRLLRKHQVPPFLLSPPYLTVPQDLLQAMNLVELLYSELINQKYNLSFLKEKNI